MKKSKKTRQKMPVLKNRKIPLLQRTYRHTNVVWRDNREDADILEILELDSGNIFSITNLSAEIFIRLPLYPTAAACLESLVKVTPTLKKKTENLLASLMKKSLIEHT